MKFTSEDLIKAMGLKIGDRIKIFNDKAEIICTLFNKPNGYYLVSEENNYYVLTSLIDLDYEIIPQPKRVGDLKCIHYIPDCFKCPIRSTCSGSVGKLNSESTLYDHLEAYKDSKISFDKEIYNLLKARLDKEVE